MDPNRIYLDMLSAMLANDGEVARERAQELHGWIAEGGCYPAEHSPEIVSEFVGNVLLTTEPGYSGSMEDGIAFSLACVDCDAGTGVDSREQALDDGWSDIEFTPDLSNANYLGLCPDCRRRHE